MTTSPIYSFGEFILDFRRGALFKAGAEVKLRPKSFEVLRVLIERHGQLVSKDQLLDAVWGRTVVTEGAVTQCVIDIRRALGDRSQQRVRTVPRRGYIFEGQLVQVEEMPDATARSSSHGARLPEIPTIQIAVLPFANLSSDPDQEYFCDGLVEDITNDLAHFPQLFVVSRNAAFTFKGSVESIRQIASQLGVGFVLHGSVRKAGDHIRVIATLEDAGTARTVWANRYDRHSADAFNLQDELTREIVTALDVEILSGAQGLHRRSKFRSAAAGRLLYRGLYEHYRFDRAAALTARKYFEEFIELEPDSILGYVWLVASWGFAIVVGWEPPEVALPKLKQCVDRSLAIDPDDAHGLVGAAQLKTLAGDLDGALESAGRAVARMPNFDEAWFVRGWIQMLLGQSDEAVQSLEHSMRLCPTVNSLKLGVRRPKMRFPQRTQPLTRSRLLQLTIVTRDALT